MQQSMFNENISYFNMRELYKDNGNDFLFDTVMTVKHVK